ncbi:MAG: hypothetical protein ACFFDS_02190 [Candidatus Thorarchaeota archaeon]
MSKFQIHNTDDLITIESKNQAIAIIGFSLSKLEETLPDYLSQKIFDYLDSVKNPYIVQLTKSTAKMFYLVSAEDVGDVINKVSKFLDKVDKIGPLDPLLLTSPINHTSIANNLKYLYNSKIKQTENQKIISIGKDFWIFSSIILSSINRRYFSKYVKNMLSYKLSTISLGARFSNQKNRSKRKLNKSILISYKFSSFEEAERYLKQIEKISFQYKQKLSFLLRFHSYFEVKRNKIMFLFGFSNQTFSSTLWRDIITVNNFVPYIKTNGVLKSQKSDLIKKQRVPLQPKNFFPEKEQEILIENKLENKTGKEDYKTLFPYGKIVSEEEINKLLKNIPPPPS